MEISAGGAGRRSGLEVDSVDLETWMPMIAGVFTGLLTGGLVCLGLWGSIQRRLGRLEARIDNLERLYAEAKAEYLRLHEEARAENARLHAEIARLNAENARQHEETRAEIRREVRLLLQVLREHHHGDGRPAVTPIPAEAD